MAILICAVNGVVGRHDAGDVIAVVEDDHIFGTHEDVDEWTKAGHAASSYPGLFYLVTCPGTDVAAVQQYTQIAESGLDDITHFRKYAFNVRATERRDGKDGRPTLFTSFKITRNYNEITDLFSLKV